MVDNVLLYGTKLDIKNEPPAIVIEIFDQDKVVRIKHMRDCMQGQTNTSED